MLLYVCSCSPIVDRTLSLSMFVYFGKEVFVLHIMSLNKSHREVSIFVVDCSVPYMSHCFSFLRRINTSNHVHCLLSGLEERKALSFPGGESTSVLMFAFVDLFIC